MFFPECENFMIITDNINIKQEEKDIVSSDYDDVSITEDRINLEDNNINIELSSNAYYYCNNCGHYNNIPNETMVFNLKDKIIDKEIITNTYLNFKNDNTLPFTKRYNCINKDCSTHKNPETKKAVFYRKNQNTYKLKYICTICNYYWE